LLENVIGRYPSIAKQSLQVLIRQASSLLSENHGQQLWAHKRPSTHLVDDVLQVFPGEVNSFVQVVIPEGLK
jgi:hypothetical protein